MDRFERARSLREEYESALDEAEKRRADYHREVLKLHRSGMSLREIAEQLGLSHQRVHQIVGVAQEPRRRGRAVAGGAAGALLLSSALAGWIALHPSPDVSPRANPSTKSQVPGPLVCYAEFPGTPSSSVPARTLAAAFKRCSSRRDVVVVLDPNTGNILAMAIRPGAARHGRHPANEDVQEPGIAPVR